MDCNFSPRQTIIKVPPKDFPRAAAGYRSAIRDCVLGDTNAMPMPVQAAIATACCTGSKRRQASMHQI